MLPGRHVLLGSINARFPAPLYVLCRENVRCEVTAWNRPSRSGQLQIVVREATARVPTADVVMGFTLQESRSVPAAVPARSEPAAVEAGRRVILVTGAAGGPGAAIAADLARFLGPGPRTPPAHGRRPEGLVINPGGARRTVDRRLDRGGRGRVKRRPALRDHPRCLARDAAGRAAPSLGRRDRPAARVRDCARDPAGPPAVRPRRSGRTCGLRSTPSAPPSSRWA
jgi:hypothetical protein